MGSIDILESTISNFHKYHIELIGTHDFEGAAIYRRGAGTANFSTRFSVWLGYETVDPILPYRYSYSTFHYNGETLAFETELYTKPLGIFRVQ